MNTEIFNGRRKFLAQLSLMSGMLLVPRFASPQIRRPRKPRMRLGMVTYQWGKDWDIPTLIENLTTAGIFGVELRVDHAHGVTPELTKEERREVRRVFRSSPVEVVGMGTNQQFDYPDRQKLFESIEQTKAFIRLSSDIGGTGVKVKPNQFHPGVPKSRTIEQIGRALSQLARYGADFGQQIRLEVHGRETQEIENIRAIMDVADHPNATVCWNSNAEDLKGNGLEYNFNLLKHRLGDITHVRELDSPNYPFQKLINLLAGINYRGWIMLECSTTPDDKVLALTQQRKIFEGMLDNAINL